MTTTTIGEYNVLFRNTARTIKGDVLELIEVCHALALNEGAKGAPHDGITAAVKEAGWNASWDGFSNWLLWNPAVFTGRGKVGVTQICRSAQDLGLSIKFNPSRHMLWRRLDHEDGTTHRFYVTHLPQGYAKPEGAFSDKVEWFKDIVAKEAVLRVDAITSRHLAKPGVLYDHLLGDMNSRQANEQQPWYPANVWDDHWVPDTLPGSIDWMLHSKRARKNGLEVVSRQTWGHDRGLDSDHRAGLKKVRWP